jgi:hypothetical protein
MTSYRVLPSCPVCGGELSRAKTGRPRKWCSDKCRMAAVRKLNQNAKQQRQWGEMNHKYIVRTYGGGPARLAHSTIDGVKNDPAIAAKIDERLQRILGGVPRGCAPRAQVVELPGPVARELKEAAA